MLNGAPQCFVLPSIKRNVKLANVEVSRFAEAAAKEARFKEEVTTSLKWVNHS